MTCYDKETSQYFETLKSIVLNGSREFSRLTKEEYKDIGVEYMEFTDYDGIISTVSLYNEFVRCVICAINNIKYGKDKTENLEDMLQSYDELLIKYIRNNRETEWDYDQIKAEMEEAE